MERVMGQGMQVGEAVGERRHETVAVPRGTAGRRRQPSFISENILVDGGARSVGFASPFVGVRADTGKSQEVLIRSVDVIVSVIVLLLAMPAMLAVTLLIKMFSPGPVLYKQRRVGRRGRLFTLCKFRTMINNAEEHTGPVWACRDDWRVTPIGRILRQTRLDELPQLFNVLRGDMSLVGPRPERPYFVQRHKALQGVRLAVKPGLTGLAQIRSFYNLKPEHKIKYDYLYIQRRSVFLNLYILLQTVPVVFGKKGW